MADIKIAGNTLTGINKINVDNATSGGADIQYRTVSGNQDITTLSEYDVSDKATARISQTERNKIIAGNIKSGVTILGVSGNIVTPSGNQDISTTDSYDVSAKATARISSTERAKIIAGNIKNGVTILGVTGSYSGGGGNDYSITPSITNGSASGATALPQGQGANVVGKTTITPSSGYYLPSSITVVNATYTYNARTGVVELHTPTGNISLSATCSSTPAIMVGDFLLAPISPSASTSDQSTWTKLCVMSVSGNTITAVPFDGMWPGQSGSTYDVPRNISCSNWMSDSNSSPCYYYEDTQYGMSTISQAYNTISMDLSTYHQSFVSALTPFSDITQYQYNGIYLPSPAQGDGSGSNGVPDITMPTTWCQNNPPTMTVRPLDIPDLALFFGGVAGISIYPKIDYFFFKDADASSFDADIMCMSVYYDSYSSSGNPYKLWSIHSPYYDSYSSTTYPGYWNQVQSYNEYSFSSNYIVPLFNVDLTQLTYVHTGTNFFDHFINS